MSLSKKIAVAFSLLRHPPAVDHPPVQANIEVSSLCNLDCIMCNRSVAVARGKTISLEQFKFVIDQVKPSTVNFSGNGEPLLNRFLDRMIGYACNRNMRTQMTSNFTLMVKHAKPMVESGLHFLKVSIDGARDETFRSVRGVPLHTVLEGVDEIVRLRDTLMRQTPRLRINMVVLDSNFLEMEDMVKLAHKHRIPAIDYKYCYSYNLEKPGARGEAPMRNIMGSIKAARKTATQLGIDTNLHILSRQIRMMYRKGGPPFPEKGEPICVAPWTWTYIDVDGRVYPCCNFAYRERSEDFGNINDTSFDHIWNGEKYQGLRREFRTRKRSYGACRHCVAPSLGMVLSNYRNIRHMMKV
jgi:radical SAM protein with 4Fe4S-binding SPASM domain